MKRTHSHIDMDKRRKIARWRMAGLSVDLIAEKLGRHRSTIFREIRRNTFTDAEFVDLNGYYCVTAHDMACERRAKLRKLARFSNVRQSVIDRIKHGWSPQQIAGWLLADDISLVRICAETIYRFIYCKEDYGLGLCRYLPEARRKRRSRGYRKPRNSVFPSAHRISQRPNYIQDRSQFGHWEGDLLIFERELGHANITSIVERTSRYVVLLKNQSRPSASKLQV